MEAKTIGNYGGPYSDAMAKENDETDMDADQGNRLLEDGAQMTRTSVKIQASFASTATGAPTTVTPTADTQWGSGSGTLPTIDKTATGRYTVTFDTEYADGLEVDETLALKRPLCQAWSADVLDDVYAQVLSIAANVVTLKVESPRGTLADVGDNSSNPINVELWTR